MHTRTIGRPKLLLTFDETRRSVRRESFWVFLYVRTQGRRAAALGHRDARGLCLRQAGRGDPRLDGRVLLGQPRPGDPQGPGSEGGAGRLARAPFGYRNVRRDGTGRRGESVLEPISSRRSSYGPSSATRRASCPLHPSPRPWPRRACGTAWGTRRASARSTGCSRTLSTRASSAGAASSAKVPTHHSSPVSSSTRSR